MKTEQTKNSKPSQMALTPVDKTLKTTFTAIILIAGAWLVEGIGGDGIVEMKMQVQK